MSYYWQNALSDQVLHSHYIKEFLWKNWKKYRNDPKRSDRWVLANSSDPDQTLQSDALLYGKATLLKF